MSTRALLLVLLLGSAFSTQASPIPCPPGSVPIPGQGRCGAPAEASAIRSSSGKAPSAPVHSEIWEDRYGAIAQDFDTGAGGTAEDQKSKREAERLALQRCGTGNCKIVSSIRNSCQAAAAGGGGVAFGAGGGQDIAKRNALLKCQSDGSKCIIKYSDCSFPIRVR
ncbi:DUF4189 domain-containing protein [Lysobacter pythonis]